MIDQQLTIELLKRIAEDAISNPLMPRALAGFTLPEWRTEGPERYALDHVIGESVMRLGPYYSFMHRLAHIMAPCTAVELGVNIGRGCISLALSSDKNRVYGVDLIYDIVLNEVMAALSNFTFIHANSVPVPEDIPHGIDILHIDTNHTYSQACGEFYAYEEFLSDVAVVLFDDTHAAEDDVLRCFDSLPYEKFVEDRLHPASGYGVLLYKRS